MGSVAGHKLARELWEQGARDLEEFRQGFIDKSHAIPHALEFTVAKLRIKHRDRYKPFSSEDIFPWFHTVDSVNPYHEPNVSSVYLVKQISTEWLYAGKTKCSLAERFFRHRDKKATDFDRAYAENPDDFVIIECRTNLSDAWAAYHEVIEIQKIPAEKSWNVFYANKKPKPKHVFTKRTNNIIRQKEILREAIAATGFASRAAIRDYLKAKYGTGMHHAVKLYALDLMHEMTEHLVPGTNSWYHKKFLS